MNGTNNAGCDGAEVDVATNLNGTASGPEPQPHQYNRLAPKHTDCPCYVDPRCQLAVAFQEARDYWARHPDDAENAPTDIHGEIEQWLVDNRLLEPTQPMCEEPQGEAEEPSTGESPAKRTGFKLLRIRPLNLRRLSLPTRDRSPALQPPSAEYVQRRNTDGEAPVRADERQDDTPPVVAPLSPRKLFRGAAGVFISARHKRSKASVPASTASDEAPEDAVDDRASASSGEPPCSDEPEEKPLVGEDGPEAAESIYDDAVDALAAFFDAAAGAHGPSDIRHADALSSRPADTESAKLPFRAGAGEEADADAPDGVDPAYAALMPILHELDALAEHPRHAAIAASHGDADYAHFWETFAQLSARDVLFAVYALRAEAADGLQLESEGQGPLLTVLAVVLALWASGASILAVYLYWHLP
ncbi:uncharacterized protein TRAVEDRAFT_73301 [Trametes versicolor FP-101664 SS1]|uniref:uncharacterized protein n=1 Tax=Trametes versicolor (strain FP-101664) TaxID=717944 RepID=UPI0004621E10|nr:uncharacterized protein TRAVEDRAFT_73301 [Trametes versicolor FP-101664 SS1]EIW57035.1 hypothetical protein TRAVEDRAFT_73301 [Trametes versicolor FP-101664 SS1]